MTLAQSESARLLELSFTPTSRAQLAIWIEDGAGTFLTTVRLTDAVATRGIGNRPGASQMNSGFRWPYGRREGVLPVWAHRRATAPGAQPFRRVIFQDRKFEGNASQNTNDSSRDDYFCLSFDQHSSAQDALDAVSCASVFTSDKGRFITLDDVASGYGEPFEDVVGHVGTIRPLGFDSPYPPRRDLRDSTRTFPDHPDVAGYQSHARSVMPEIDAATMATPPGHEPSRILYPLPAAWSDGTYQLCLEINVEGDYNATFNPTTLPMPTTPRAAWDDWAARSGFGYPYRGQPSVVYCLAFTLGGAAEQTFATAQPLGTAGNWDTMAPEYGRLNAMDGMTDDAVHASGSGADRLLRDANGQRLSATVRRAGCDDNRAPSTVDDLTIEPYDDELHAHEWATLQFRPATDDGAVFSYDVRVSSDPIVDEVSFIRASPAKNASIEAEALRVPTVAVGGELIRADIGGLVNETHYFVGVRAIDRCGAVGSLVVAEVTTARQTFATVTPCFVASAAYGTPMATEVAVLRRLRDRHLANHWLGRAAIAAYWRIGPPLAAHIRNDETLRGLVRAILTPLVLAAHALVGEL